MRPLSEFIKIASCGDLSPEEQMLFADAVSAALTWQPIETADKEPYLALDLLTSDRTRHTDAYWGKHPDHSAYRTEEDERECWREQGAGYPIDGATHWMRVPREAGL